MPRDFLKLQSSEKQLRNCTCIYSLSSNLATSGAVRQRQYAHHKKLFRLKIDPKVMKNGFSCNQKALT